jgi:uncharacterized LabA/DUF88 family protein
MSGANPQKLLLKGKTAVFIDYANVYGWRKSLNKPVDPSKLFEYLKKYSEINNIEFYYGTDTNPKSKAFITKIAKYGYSVVTKPVKYINVSENKKRTILIRKCDFDIEICMSVYKHLEKKTDSFLFFSGDGDLAALYQFLIDHHKQVIVIYQSGHLGKEVWQIKKGIFKTEITNFPVF